MLPTGKAYIEVDRYSGVPKQLGEECGVLWSMWSRKAGEASAQDEAKSHCHPTQLDDREHRV